MRGWILPDFISDVFLKHFCREFSFPILFCPFSARRSNWKKVSRLPRGKVDPIVWRTLKKQWDSLHRTIGSVTEVGRIYPKLPQIPWDLSPKSWHPTIKDCNHSIGFEYTPSGTLVFWGTDMIPASKQQMNSTQGYRCFRQIIRTNWWVSLASGTARLRSYNIHLWRGFSDKKVLGIQIYPWSLRLV